MKEEHSIPAGKVERAMKFIKTGAKVGSNYVKHYSKRVFDPALEKETLDRQNAEEIFKSLGELKGSALKVAQMVSQEKNFLPSAFADEFMKAQYKAPALSYPLVVRTFHKYFGKSPDEMFDTFSKQAVNAASIGQVHKASLKNLELAVKIQYPGVAESVSSDLRLIRPFAERLMNIKSKELDQYFAEVEERLLEETDYELELRRSLDLSSRCAHIPHLRFPEYYPELSSARIITMGWLDGMHLKEFLQSNPSQQVRNQIGQALWDFFEYQIHELHQVHADPHPGNFLFSLQGDVGVIDFGCVKEIPEDFYKDFFGMVKAHVHKDNKSLNEIFYRLGFLYEEDSEKEKKFFSDLFNEMLAMLCLPLTQPSFDFSNKQYFAQLFEMGNDISRMKEVRNTSRARGPRHALYINRTYFGLYQILHELQAEVKTQGRWLEI
jgi:predicted unusual protein kinase regulating ubiquinone biosynthesis (AarF/ABC1/UbiB family)